MMKVPGLEDREEHLLILGISLHWDKVPRFTEFLNACSDF